jgi:hypothetical protein
VPVTVVTEKTGAAVTDPQPELVYQVVFLLRQHSQQCGGTPCMQSVSSICGAKKRDSLSSTEPLSQKSTFP